MEALTKLFGSQQKIRLMRLFLMHTDTQFTFEEILSKTKIRKEILKKEILWLTTTTLIKKQNKTIKNARGVKKVISLYMINPRCVFKSELKVLIAPKGDNLLDTLKNRFQTAGKLDLLIASGFFIQNPDSRMDLLIVGKQLKKSRIETTIASLEAEIGKELLYGFFDTEDFLYRAHMYDKLIRDVIDFSHIKVVDTGILSKVPKMS
jgi:hypothetical protein